MDDQPESRSRFLGCLTGLAVGDAVGTTLEFKPPGSFKPIADMIGGGPFHLKPGQWTDDTSMALCLAASLLEKKSFDPIDQLERYLKWYETGYMSSTGRCFDIGNTVRGALDRFKRTRAPYCGSTDPRSAGNGSLMRLAPVPMFFLGDTRQAIERCADSSRTTHGAEAAMDACRYFGALILGALAGTDKAQLLAPRFSPLPGCWEAHPLTAEIDEIAASSFRRKQPPEIRGTGHVVRSLEAALWAFHHSTSFEEGCLLAVNLGDDADTTGAVYGQLAGAVYGLQGIPPKWVERLAQSEMIIAMAEELFKHASRPTPN